MPQRVQILFVISVQKEQAVNIQNQSQNAAVKQIRNVSHFRVEWRFVDIGLQFLK